MKTMDAHLKRASQSAVRKAIRDRALQRNPVPGYADDDIPISGGGGGGPVPLPNVTNLRVYTWAPQNLTKQQTQTGTAASLSRGGNDLTIGTPNPTVLFQVRMWFEIAGSAVPANNGSWFCRAVPYVLNAAGTAAATESPFPGTYRTMGRVLQSVDLVNGYVFVGQLNETAYALRDDLVIAPGRPVFAVAQSSVQRIVCSTPSLMALYNGTQSFSTAVYVASGPLAGVNGGGAFLAPGPFGLSVWSLQTGATYVCRLTILSATQVRFERQVGVGQTVTLSTPIPLSTWNTVGISYDAIAGVFTVYLNGALVGASAPFATSAIACDGWWWGNNNASAGNFVQLGGASGNAFWSPAEQLEVHQNFVRRYNATP